MMQNIIIVLNKLIGLILLPTNYFNIILGLFYSAFLTAILALIIYKYFSPQNLISKTKKLIKAHILEVVLYSNFVKTTFKCYWNIIRLNIKYLLLALIPLLIMIFPVVIMMIQLDLKYAYKQISANEEKLLIIKSYDLKKLENIRMIEDDNVVLKSTPVIIKSAKEKLFKIQPLKRGTFDIKFKLNDKILTKQISVDNEYNPVSLSRVDKTSIKKIFFNPIESPIETNSGIKEIKFYKSEYNKNFTNDNWIWIYFILTLVFGFLLKDLFRVEF